MQTPQRSIPNRILGIDYGLSRIGLALSDENHLIAMPLMVVQASKKSEITVLTLIKTIQEINLKYQCTISEIIIGLPLMMSGKTGFLADEVKHFVQLFSQNCEIPIRTWDERLTTVQAERSLREGNLTRKKRTKLVDTVSACIILQSYLDSLPSR
jgi:putative Holliday junction resolvase